MIGTRLIAAGLALVAGLALTPATHAGDTFRLDMPGPAKTTTLALDTNDGADLIDAGWYRGGVRGGFYGGGYRGGYGGYRGGFYGGGYRGGYVGYRGGYYGGYRGGYYGGYRPYYGSFYRPYYGGYYGGYYRPAYYPQVYYGSGYSYNYPYYYAPCSLPDVVPTMPSVTLRVTPAPSSGVIIPNPDGSLPSQVPGGTLPVPTPQQGTFPYDGGPKSPVPMPRIEEAAPANNPGSAIRPADERFVSFPTPDLSARAVGVAPQGKWAYPAYGEQPRRTTFADDRVIRPGR